MKKTIIILTLLSFVLCLSAQLSEQGSQSQQTEKKGKLIKQEKQTENELKLKKTNEAKKTVQVKEADHSKDQKGLKTELKALRKANKVLQAERDELTTKLVVAQRKNETQTGRYNKFQNENKELKQVNAKLRARIEELKPAENKKVKSIEKG